MGTGERGEVAAVYCDGRVLQSSGSQSIMVGGQKRGCGAAVTRTRSGNFGGEAAAVTHNRLLVGAPG